MGSRRDGNTGLSDQSSEGSLVRQGRRVIGNFGGYMMDNSDQKNRTPENKFTMLGLPIARWNQFSNGNGSCNTDSNVSDAFLTPCYEFHMSEKCIPPRDLSNVPSLFS